MRIILVSLAAFFIVLSGMSVAEDGLIVPANPPETPYESTGHIVTYRRKCDLPRPPGFYLRSCTKVGLNDANWKGVQEDAAAGKADAQVMVGFSKENLAEGIEWYKRAAAQNNIDALILLGQAYSTGRRGIKKDYAEAVRWYRQAADLSDWRSPIFLGYLYLEGGNGIEQSYEEAYFWFCASEANPEVDKARKEALLHLSPTQIANVDVTLSKWRARKGANPDMPWIVDEDK